MKLSLPTGVPPYQRHRLDPAKIVETAENLARNVGESFSGTALAGLAVELAALAHRTDELARHARKPIYAIRVCSALAALATILGLCYLASHIHARWEFGTIGELFDATDAGFNLLVLLAGAVWFMITLETRIKRKKALECLEELRDFIHVIDVTQLYYTPDIYRSDPSSFQSSVNLDYTYLLFCTQMLGLISNLAPLYARGAAGDSIMRAVSDVELLANDITVKLLTKVGTVRVVPKPD
jgi:hypothetical protein